MSAGPHLPVLQPRDLIECGPLRATMAARHCVELASRTMRRPLGCAGCARGAEVRAALGAPEPPAYRPIRGNLMFPPTPPRCSVSGREKAASVYTVNGAPCEPRCRACGEALRHERKTGRTVDRFASTAPSLAERTQAADDLLRLHARLGSWSAVALEVGASESRVVHAARGSASRATAQLVALAAARLLPKSAPCVPAARISPVEAWAPRPARSGGAR